MKINENPEPQRPENMAGFPDEKLQILKQAIERIKQDIRTRKEMLEQFQKEIKSALAIFEIDLRQINAERLFPGNIEQAHLVFSPTSRLILLSNRIALPYSF